MHDRHWRRERKSRVLGLVRDDCALYMRRFGQGSCGVLGLNWNRHMHHGCGICERQGFCRGLDRNDCSRDGRGTRGRTRGMFGIDRDGYVHDRCGKCEGSRRILGGNRSCRSLDVCRRGDRQGLHVGNGRNRFSLNVRWYCGRQGNKRRRHWIGRMFDRCWFRHGLCIVWWPDRNGHLHARPGKCICNECGGRSDGRDRHGHNRVVRW